MKKKILALGVCASMLAVAVVGGTMAYFTDTKQATNTMATGNIKIQLNEQKRGTEGMEDFDDSDITFMPMVYNADAAESNKVDDAIANTKVFSARFSNVVDKFVSVTNTGDDEAYVRVLFAFEGDVGVVEDYIGYNINDDADCDFSFVHENYDGNGKLINARGIMDGEGTTWSIAEAVYPAAIANKQTTPYSLKQIFLAPSATSEGIENHFGTNLAYDIKVVAQATQEAGFSTAREALNTSFGNVQAAYGDADFVDDATLLEWFGLPAVTTPAP